ncbi:TetR/AcrR family transcriptional regulator [Fulvivirga ulvae]|uniref:TetR/AcrR family transcriptional regulator n=1 Tax=Fulvivirga ulvae TaxID=2904245 RepID=UPI001F165457|nr:TetR/AcrR family transcriptional regulator [Fulvivirga ulvae]UII35004.1 TetR/AcrR family transcriptional regulator [Fulvivirga ulvae]
MRPPKILDQDLLAALTSVFRARGYEGASLKELSDETGLKKASLYHRFPNGKQEMAESVLDHMEKWVQDHIFVALTDLSVLPEERLEKGLVNIRKLYGGGKETCIFRAFSMQMGLELFQQSLSNGMKGWISAFIDLGLSLALTPEVAREMAVQTLIEIQGSLILSQVMNDESIFENSLQLIKRNYLSS